MATDTTKTTTSTEETAEKTGSRSRWRQKGVDQGNLILINKEHSYDFPNGDPKLESVYEKRNSSYSVSDMEVQLDAETIAQLNK